MVRSFLVSLPLLPTTIAHHRYARRDAAFQNVTFTGSTSIRKDGLSTLFKWQRISDCVRSFE